MPLSKSRGKITPIKIEQTTLIKYTHQSVNKTKSVDKSNRNKSVTKKDYTLKTKKSTIIL